MGVLTCVFGVFLLSTGTADDHKAAGVAPFDENDTEEGDESSGTTMCALLPPALPLPCFSEPLKANTTRTLHTQKTQPEIRKNSFKKGAHDDENDENGDEDAGDLRSGRSSMVRPSPAAKKPTTNGRIGELSDEESRPIRFSNVSGRPSARVQASEIEMT